LALLQDAAVLELDGDSSGGCSAVDATRLGPSALWRLLPAGCGSRVSEADVAAALQEMNAEAGGEEVPMAVDAAVAGAAEEAAGQQLLGTGLQRPQSMATGAEASCPAAAVACANVEAQPPPPSPAASASSSAAASTVSGDSSSADSTEGRAAGAPVDSVSALAARSQPGSTQLPATSSEGRQRLRKRKRQEAEAGSEAAAAKLPSVPPGAALARLQLAQEHPHMQDLALCTAVRAAANVHQGELLLLLLLLSCC
jgi:hypothetical protein